jgi:hypothetical protein
LELGSGAGGRKTKARKGERKGRKTLHAGNTASVILFIFNKAAKFLYLGFPILGQ